MKETEAGYQQSKKVTVVGNINKKRDLTLDIAKAICICLMVIGHSGCPDYLDRFVYMFHMPCFFFVSGWLLSDRYLSDLKTGLYQKAKGSYYPFVKWTLIFLLFHNVFASLHIYEASYSLQTFVERIVRAFTLTGSEQLLGGFWFLISLFWASVGSLFFLYILHKRSALICNNILRGGVILLLATATFWHYFPIQLPQMFGEQTILATAFYMSGYLCHKKDLQFKHPLIKGTSFLLIPAIVAIFIKLNMATVEGWLVLLDYAVAMTGTIGVILLSRGLAKKCIASVLGYIGNKTLYILVFHFLAFKLVSFVYIRSNGLPIELLAQSPVLEETNSWMWVIYTIVGVSLSLLVCELLHLPFLRFKRNGTKKEHIL